MHTQERIERLEDILTAAGYLREGVNACESASRRVDRLENILRSAGYLRDRDCP